VLRAGEARGLAIVRARREAAARDEAAGARAAAADA
jgi:hypothetical protein